MRGRTSWVARAFILPATLALLTSCGGGSTVRVRVSGHLYAAFGPYPVDKIHHPLDGAIRLINVVTHQVTLATANSDHGYSVSVPPGRYVIKGASPKWDNGNWVCLTRYPVMRVQLGRTNRIDVACLGI